VPTEKYMRFTFVTNRQKEISEAIYRIDKNVRGMVETYYEDGWLCDRCGCFYRQRTEPVRCWQCEENVKNGMSVSPGSCFIPM